VFTGSQVVESGGIAISTTVKNGGTVAVHSCFGSVTKDAKKITDKSAGVYGVCLRGKAGWGENMASPKWPQMNSTARSPLQPGARLYPAVGAAPILPISLRLERQRLQTSFKPIQGDRAVTGT
jgi:autotransporter passenger strand-loop-strand repeat protein